jgi:hypothetical protein
MVTGRWPASARAANTGPDGALRAAGIWLGGTSCGRRGAEGGSSTGQGLGRAGHCLFPVDGLGKALVIPARSHGLPRLLHFCKGAATGGRGARVFNKRGALCRRYAIGCGVEKARGGLLGGVELSGEGALFVGAGIGIGVNIEVRVRFKGLRFQQSCVLPVELALGPGFAPVVAAVA